MLFPLGIWMSFKRFLKRRRVLSRGVFPFFCGIDPSDVKHKQKAPNKLLQNVKNDSKKTKELQNEEVSKQKLLVYVGDS